MQRKAFTLVEILIVVIILGILAAIIIPQFSNAALESRETMMLENIRVMRTQINIYKAQHDDLAPGYKGENLTEENFVDQLTKFTDAKGNVNDTKTEQYSFGPYLSEIPLNPLSHINGVSIITNDQEMPETATHGNGIGWIYKASTVNFRANSEGSDSAGDDYYDY